jgi:hypothetical protein
VLCISLSLFLSILFVVQVGAQKFTEFGISVGWHLALYSVVCKQLEAISRTRVCYLNSKSVAWPHEPLASSGDGAHQLFLYKLINFNFKS